MRTRLIYYSQMEFPPYESDVLNAPLGARIPKAKVRDAKKKRELSWGSAGMASGMSHHSASSPGLGAISSRSCLYFSPPREPYLNSPLVHKLFYAFSIA